MTGAELIQMLGVLLGGGSISGGLMFLVFMRQKKKQLSVETDSVAVGTTERAVVVLQSVISSLAAENTRLKERGEQYEKEISDLHATMKRIDARGKPR